MAQNVAESVENARPCDPGRGARGRNCADVGGRLVIDSICVPDRNVQH